MTFNSAPWALDGARLTSSLARLGIHAPLGDVEGVVGPDDLKVTQLDVPGVGIQIAGGGAVLLNRYQTTPNESYVVANEGVEIIGSGDMPPASVSAESWLVCATIYDPQYSQLGHPWAPGTDPGEGEEAENFQYVRPFLLGPADGVTSSTKRFSELGLSFPAYALARIDRPASTTTITDAIITDLRKLVNPQTKRTTHLVQPAAGTLTSAAIANYPNGKVDVEVPTWATKAQVIVHISQIAHWAPNFNGYLRATLGAQVGGWVGLDFDSVSGAERHTFMAAATFDIPEAYRGTTQEVKTQAYRQSGTGYLQVYGATHEVFDIEFLEEPV